NARPIESEPPNIDSGGGAIALTGVQEPVSPMPFGAATLVVERGPLVDIWKNLREQMVADDEAVSACLHDGVPDCAAAETLLRIINDAKAHKGKALIGYVNRAINLLIRPAPGAWVGALEVLSFADGDCKDYSIAKFFALRCVTRAASSCDCTQSTAIRGSHGGRRL